MSWFGGAAAEPEKQPEPVTPEPKDEGPFWNAYNYTIGGVVYGATKTKDGFVYTVVGGAEYIGDGYQWCEDTASWAWNGTSTWAGDNLSCGAASTPKN